MARNETYDLTDAEKRDLIQLIQKGKPLPEKYRFILFEDKRELELVWNDNIREVCTTILPFQTLEHIDESRTETKVQTELFDTRGRQLRPRRARALKANRLAYNPHQATRSNSRRAGPAATSSKTNDKASAPAGIGSWNSSPPSTPTSDRASTRWR